MNCKQHVNFIGVWQLDFSGIGRDKVSGQASAEIGNSRPYDFGRNPNTTSGQVSTSQLNFVTSNVFVNF